MEKKITQKALEQIKTMQFPCGTCCANCCRDCRYMEMDNDHYNDGTRRCAYKGAWLRPSTPACPNFSY